MSSEIAVNDVKPGQLVAVVQSTETDDGFGDVASSGKWLGRIQLFGAKSREVAENKIGMAHYGLITGKDNLADLGKEVDCLPVAWRPRAMDIGGENILSSTDKDSAEFKRMVSQSEVKDSGCMYGPEFLIWLPSLHKWGLYFANSKTARRAAPALRERLGKGVTLKATFIKTAKFAWHGPEFAPCSTPFDLPSAESVAEETERFLHPPVVAQIEKAPDAGNRAR